MFVRIASRFSIGTLGLLAVLSGCGNGSNTSVPSAANLGTPVSMAGALPDNNGKGHGSGCKSDLVKGGGGAVIYTAQLYGHDVKVYAAGGHGLKYVCTLSQGILDPQGAVSTVNGWLYVTNGSGMNVLVYRTKKGLPQGPLSSLSDYNEIPFNVDVNPSRNLVAVSNYTTTASGSGSVSVYLHRQSVPTRTLTYSTSGMIYGSGIAIDHKGNCYWAFDSGPNYTGSGTIVEFPRCNGNGTLLISETFPIGGLAFDQSGDLYFVDSDTGTEGGAIYECTKTSASSCKAFSVGYPFGFVQPLNMNFDYHGKDLWVADLGGYIDEVDPSTGDIIYRYGSLSSDPPFGIAPEPGS